MLMVMVIIATYSEVETSTRKRNVSKYIKQLNMLKLMLYWLLQNWIDLHVMYHLQVLYIMVILILCCDNPSANKLTIQILSVIAENEAEMISVRTKETLAIKKANIAKGIYTKDGSSMKPDVNGVYRLGNPIGFNLANQIKGVAAIKACSCK
jgi:hypothetical protein